MQNDVKTKYFDEITNSVKSIGLEKLKKSRYIRHIPHKFKTFFSFGFSPSLIFSQPCPNALLNIAFTLICYPLFKHFYFLLLTRQLKKTFNTSRAENSQTSPAVEQTELISSQV